MKIFKQLRRTAVMQKENTHLLYCSPSLILAVLMISLPFNSEQVAAAVVTNTEFNTGSEPIQKQQVAILSIPGADALEISIRGELDTSHDVLRIYTLQNGKTLGKIFEGKGRVERSTPLIVKGDSIKVTFNALKPTTRPGALVSIATLSPMTLISQIKENINQVLRNIEHKGAALASQEIEKSLIHFQALQAKLQAGHRADAELVQMISTALTQLSYSYARIAKLQKTLKETHSSALKQLADLKKQTQTYAEQTAQRQNAEEQQVKQAQHALLSVTVELERKKLEIAVKARQSLAKSLTLQHQAWLAFLQAQTALIPALEDYLQNLDLLFYSLNLNADIYQETANVIQQNAAFAAETLGGIHNLREIIEALTQNWKNIEALSMRLNEIGF